MYVCTYVFVMKFKFVAVMSVSNDNLQRLHD